MEKNIDASLVSKFRSIKSMFSTLEFIVNYDPTMELIPLVFPTQMKIIKKG